MVWVSIVQYSIVKPHLSKPNTNILEDSYSADSMLFPSRMLCSLKIDFQVPTCIRAQLLSLVWLSVTALDCSPPGSSGLGIFQERILEWVANSSSGVVQGLKQHLPGLLHWQTDSFTSEPLGKHLKYLWMNLFAGQGCRCRWEWTRGHSWSGRKRRVRHMGEQGSHICTAMCETDRGWEASVYHRPLSSTICDDPEEWDKGEGNGGARERGCMCTQSRFMFPSRNQHNSVK